MGFTPVPEAAPADRDGRPERQRGQARRATGRRGVHRPAGRLARRRQAEPTCIATSAPAVGKSRPGHGRRVALPDARQQ